MYYTEELKLTVVRRVLNKELTKAEARRKYSIKGHSTICKWIKKYGYLFDVKQTKEIIMKDQNAQIQEYKKKIAELEKALSQKNKEYENKALEARLWKKMVELAEKEFDIIIKKKLWAITIRETKFEDNKLNISQAVECFNYSRQYYYSQIKKRRLWYDLEELIVGLILGMRDNDHIYGMDKTYYFLRYVFTLLGVKAGRDKIRKIMRDNGLKIKVKRRARYSTPIAMEDAENMMFGLTLTKPNQVWFSDITYIRTRENGVIRLALVMDGYSRRILSYKLGNEALIANKALEEALKYGVPEIHHSDRGIDYINDGYTYLLKKNGIKPSYSRAGVPQDNGIMERTIGTLKNELKLKNCKNIEELKRKTEEVIRFYNDSRPHMSCHYNTPSSIYFNYNFFNKNCQLILA